MDLTLKVWRQKNREDRGGLVTYKVTGISENSSFLEMLDVMNEQLIMEGIEPVAFDHDCREGICGSCSLYINGEAHGCLLYTSPSPRDRTRSRMPSSA